MIYLVILFCNGENIYEYFYAEVDGRFDMICNSLKQRGFSLDIEEGSIIIKVTISW